MTDANHLLSARLARIGQGAGVATLAGNRFGLETDKPVETMRLRASHGDDLRTADSIADFQIVPAPKLDTWRPGLTRATSLPGHFGRKR